MAEYFVRLDTGINAIPVFFVEIGAFCLFTLSLHDDMILSLHDDI